MFISKLFAPAIIALGLALAAPAFAAEPHGHGDTAVQLRLDNGKKWQTDDALRRGMSEIRTAMAEALTPIHEGTFAPPHYEVLVTRIQDQLDHVVGNCKLPEEADQQLHIVLEQIIDGIADMKAMAGRDKGAVKIVRALDQYGQYFDHAGWRSLTH
jgi:hypothetical protein